MLHCQRASKNFWRQGNVGRLVTWVMCPRMVYAPIYRITRLEHCVLFCLCWPFSGWWWSSGVLGMAMLDSTSQDVWELVNIFPCITGCNNWESGQDNWSNAKRNVHAGVLPPTWRHPLCQCFWTKTAGLDGMVSCQASLFCEAAASANATLVRTSAYRLCVVGQILSAYIFQLSI